MIRVVISGKAESCVASVKPAGPHPTISTSTSPGGVAAPGLSTPAAAREIAGSPGAKPSRWYCMDRHFLPSADRQCAVVSSIQNIGEASGVVRSVVPQLPAQFDDGVETETFSGAYNDIAGTRRIGTARRCGAFSPHALRCSRPAQPGRSGRRLRIEGADFVRKPPGQRASHHVGSVPGDGSDPPEGAVPKIHSSCEPLL